MAKESDLVIDIESTGIQCHKGTRNDHVTSCKRAKNMLKSLGIILSFKGSDKGQDVTYNNSISRGNKYSLKASDHECNDIESSTSNKFGGEKRENYTRILGKSLSKEKHKTRSSKKPPRPRKGPSLSTSDLRLVKEISEMIMKKHARIERLKSLKKTRATRPSSSSSSYIGLFVTIITVIVLILIILQGFGSSKSSTFGFHETPKPGTTVVY